MLHEFITTHRVEILARCRTRALSNRSAPAISQPDLDSGVPLFLDQLADTLHATLGPGQPTVGENAVKHAAELLKRGYTIAQVVHDYGGVCQATTELATERGVTFTALEFKAFNMCLDDAIAGAVTEYSRLREHEDSARAGHLAHELRNLLETAVLSFEVLKSGSVGVGGATGGVLERSLLGLRGLIDRELTEARLKLGIDHREDVVVSELIEKIKLAATMHATAHNIRFSVRAVEQDVNVHVDRQVIGSVLMNLLHNAFKFTREGGLVSLRAHATGDRVFIDIEDECGGLPPGRVGQLLEPIEQRSADRSGLGFGLGICLRGAQLNDGSIRLQNRPGNGCIFTLELPRLPLAAA